MRILFLGYVVSAKEADELTGASVAGNRMQLELVREMSGIPGVELDVCSILPVATFPKEPRVRIAATRREIKPGLVSYRPGFLTLPILKQLSQILGVTHTASRMAARQHYDHVLTFNMHPIVGVAAWWLKKRRGIPIACLLADPPVPTDRGSTWLFRAALKAYDWWTRSLLTTADRVISLTAEGARRFAPQARVVVIDGGVSPSRLDSVTPRLPDGAEKKILFTGALVPYNGIAEAVEAMRHVTDASAVLHVYGNGPMSRFVETSARTMRNVVFHGKVDGSVVPALQRDAFLLLNPRQIEHPVSDVTFPSKLLEYMLSGTPVLTTRLRSISSDYAGSVYFSDVGSPEDLATQIDRLCALPHDERVRVGDAARQFVLENRTWSAAAERVVRFLSEDQDPVDETGLDRRGPAICTSSRVAREG